MTLSNDFLSPLNKIQRGTSYPAVRDSDVFSQTVPLPPENEQIRIVAKIEELFTKLDAGKEELLQAKARLKRYRQSVLKVAMEGKLTEDWRKKHGDEIEPASVLLDRILKERREKWETEQLEQMMTKGKMPKDDKWRNKYKEPQAPEISKLPKLPEGWCWVTMEQISWLNPKIDKSQIPDDILVSFVPMSAVEAETGAVDVSQFKPFSEVKKGYTPFKEGDVLFAKITPCMENGKMVVVPSLKNAYGFGSTEFHVIRPINSIKPHYIYYFVSRASYRGDAASKMTGSAGQKRVPVSFLEHTLVPLPTFSEQKAIVSQVERYLSVADAVEATLDAELKRSDALRQSILKQAFSGKLVPQDPNDEPAEKLLERIKKEKAKLETEQKTNRKAKKQLALFEH